MVPYPCDRSCRLRQMPFEDHDGAVSVIHANPLGHHGPRPAKTSPDPEQLAGRTRLRVDGPTSACAVRDARPVAPDAGVGLIGLIRWYGQYLLTSGVSELLRRRCGVPS
jgi:hypothetical protein